MVPLTDKNQCFGCSACQMVCPVHTISMKRDTEGFLYPVTLKKNCIDCHLCEKVCPALNKNRLIEYSPICYAARAKNYDLRINSSSGGLFSLLAKEVLQEGGLVFGAAFNADFSRVSHIAIDNEDDLSLLRGSKYLQSDMGKSYRMVQSYLKQYRKVLFSGTPCQIAGLKNFLGNDDPYLITVSVICHGAPSPSIWNSYLNKIVSLIGEKPSHINMRDKSSGWRNYNLGLYYQNNSSSFLPASSSPYMISFLGNYSLRPSCYSCTCKSPIASDITLGDFWGIESVLPEMDDDKGTSVVIVNTSKGKAFFDKIECEKRRVSYSDGLKHNPSLVSMAARPRFRSLFFFSYRVLGFRGIKCFLRVKGFLKHHRF